MTHASVFSGIGGPEVAAAMLGWENLFHCEINPFGRAVLDYWFPNSESYEDITKTDFSKWRGRVDVLTGGFPCQPFSCAGQRRGADDDRYLWPYMFRCIDQIRPTWVIGENVGGILTMVERGQVVAVEDAPTLFDEDGAVHRYEYHSTFTLERICRDLETHGYDVQPISIPAASVGAPHKRDRVFILARRIDADTNGNGDTPQGESAAGARQGTDLVSRQTGCRQGHTPGGDNGLSAILRTAADTDGDRGRKVDEPLESEVADGTEPVGNGGQWDAYSIEGRWKYENGLYAPTVSAVYGGGYGLPFPVDDLTIPFPKWKNESIKAYGNAIVPQVMYEIFRAIEMVENPTPKSDESIPLT